ncbi:MAG: neutral zinc metallopeptidase, partial [Gammaproteobacteria bacterium]
MRLDRMRRSSNVEDARGQRAGGGGLGGLGGLGGGGGRGGLKLGLGGIVLALIASWLLGIDPRVALGVVQGGAAVAGAADGSGAGMPGMGSAAGGSSGAMGAPTDAAGDAA